MILQLVQGMLTKRDPEKWRRGAVAGAIIAFLMAGTLSLAFAPLVETRSTVQLQVGDVAARDIPAPRSLVYESDVLTEQAQQEAILAIEDIYDPNPDATRQQINLARQITTYVNEVRHDPYVEPDVLIEDLLVIDALTVSEDTWIEIINLPDARWDLISNEVSALVERTMQRDVRPDNLDDIRGELLNSVASRFSNSESRIIAAITEDLIQVNTFFNEDQTRLVRENAAANVPPQERSFEQGQLIVRSGNIITEFDMEALRQFGLLQAGGIQIQLLLGAFLAMVLTTGVLWFYIERFQPLLLQNLRMLALLAVVFSLFLASINLFGEEGANQPYLYPAAGLGLLLTSLVSPQLAIICSMFLAMLGGLTIPEEQSLEITTYILLGNLAGILSLSRVERLNSYFLAGIFIGIMNLIVMLVFAMTAEDLPSLGQLIARGFLTIGNGLFAAGIALVALYLITSVMNLPTSLKLIELQDSKHPLLQQLLREAPGTYQHSLQVGNLAEIAAEGIGANAQLVRVAAMYHDIGKTLNPFYFGENTAMGMNPHEDLKDPVKSAKVIIGHVIEGDRMARRANLPARIRDFILEHHGTTQVLYFYNQALDNANQDESAVDINDFTYPGPAPRSRETAIMMLADGCESATRSRRPERKEDIEEMVNTIFELRLSEGQLDDSGLTLNDLQTVRYLFVETLQAMYHPRIAYKTTKRETSETKAQLSTGIVKHLEKGDDERTTSPKPPKADEALDKTDTQLLNHIEAEALTNKQILTPNDDDPKTEVTDKDNE